MGDAGHVYKSPFLNISDSDNDRLSPPPTDDAQLQQEAVAEFNAWLLLVLQGESTEIDAVPQALNERVFTSEWQPTSEEFRNFVIEHLDVISELILGNRTSFVELKAIYDQSPEKLAAVSAWEVVHILEDRDDVYFVDLCRVYDKSPAALMRLTSIEAFFLTNDEFYARVQETLQPQEEPDAPAPLSFVERFATNLAARERL